MPVIQSQVGLQLERIVVATDFSTEIETVIDYARALAKHYSSRLTIANVVDLSAAPLSAAARSVGHPIDEIRHKSAENMERVLCSLDKAGVRASGQILEAYIPASAIVELAGQIHADMIVMGTHARHGLPKLVLGSCAEGVVHHAKCPVVTLGPKMKRATRVLNINTIVFATDLEHDTVEKAAVALTFAKDNVAKIYMCHVLEHAGKDFGDAIERQLKTESALRRLIPESTYEWCSPEAIVKHGKVGEHILYLSKRVCADLLVMGARRNATWFSQLAEGVVGHVVAEAECPVMTICTD